MAVHKYVQLSVSGLSQVHCFRADHFTQNKLFRIFFLFKNIMLKVVTPLHFALKEMYYTFKNY